MLQRLIVLLSGLQVFRGMQRDLDLSGGLIMAEALMLELGKQIGRQRAHDAVYDAAQASVTQERSFRELLAKAHDGTCHRRKWKPCWIQHSTRDYAPSSPSAARGRHARRLQLSRGGSRATGSSIKGVGMPSTLWTHCIIEQFKNYNIRSLRLCTDSIIEQILKLARQDPFFDILPLAREEEGIGGVTRQFIRGRRRASAAHLPGAQRHQRARLTGDPVPDSYADVYRLPRRTRRV